jgi:N utilization substance protein B
MQALFAADVAGEGADALIALEERISEAMLNKRAARYARELVEGVTRHRTLLDRTMQDATPTWRIENLAAVDRAILWVALFELIVDNKTPLRAVINEAVELAKAYGGEHSGRFINGVLGSVASRPLVNRETQLES